MAGLPWIKVAVDLPRNKKSWALGLKLGSDTAWAHMVQLWCWAAENLPEGRFDGEHAASVIERAAGWRGAAGAFVEAALEVGFLDGAGNQHGLSYALHDWLAFAGAHVAKREADRRRKRSGRNNSGRVTRNSSDIPRDIERDSAETERNRAREIEIENRSNRSNLEQEISEPPLLLELRRRIMAGLCITNDRAIRVAGNSEQVPVVRALLDAEIRRLGMDAAAGLCIQAARGLHKRKHKYPNVLSYFVPVLREAAMPSAVEPEVPLLDRVAQEKAEYEADLARTRAIEDADWELKKKQAAQAERADA